MRRSRVSVCRSLLEACERRLEMYQDLGARIDAQALNAATHQSIKQGRNASRVVRRCASRQQFDSSPDVELKAGRDGTCASRRRSDADRRSRSFQRRRLSVPQSVLAARADARRERFGPPRTLGRSRLRQRRTTLLGVIRDNTSPALLRTPCLAELDLGTQCFGPRFSRGRAGCSIQRRAGKRLQDRVGITAICRVLCQ